MANAIKLKRSGVPGKQPALADLTAGELAVNYYDGKLYTKRDQNGTEAIVELSGGGGGGGATLAPVLEAKQVILQDYSIAGGSNAVSLWSVEIGSGYSLTVPSGSTYTVASF